MLFDEILHVDEASEPSNIIWENLQDPASLLNKRKIVVFTIIFLIFVAIFLAFTVMKIQVSKLDSQYPKTTDCALMEIN